MGARFKRAHRAGQVMHINWLLGARITFIVLGMIVTYLTVTPDTDSVQSGFDVMAWISNFIFQTTDLADKVAHFAAYGALGFSGFFAQIVAANRTSWLAGALGLHGASLEGVQGFVAARSPEIADAIANASGAIAGCALAALVAIAAQKMLRERP